LKDLGLLGCTAPIEFVAASAATLARLELDPDCDTLLEPLSSAAFAPRFVQLSSLVISNSLIGLNLATPPLLVRLIASLPALNSLTLRLATTQQLHDLLTALPPSRRLANLATKLIRTVKAPHGPFSEALSIRFVPILMECIASGAIQTSGQWTISVLTVGNSSDDRTECTSLAALEDWDTGLEGWKEFRHAVQKAGVELVLGEF